LVPLAAVYTSKNPVSFAFYAVGQDIVSLLSGLMPKKEK
jgi:hypothetical protein